MTAVHFAQLLLLAAIWGSSFLFMRVAVDTLGPLYLIEGRVFFAALSLFLLGLIGRRFLRLKGNLKHYFIVGLFNSAIPFVLFAYGAQTLTVAILAVLNSTAPFWGTLIDAIWHKARITSQVLIGLVLGISGVSLMVGLDPNLLNATNGLAIGAGLLATLSYGIASNYAKYAQDKVTAFENAQGGLWAASIILVPLLPFFPMAQTPTFDVGLAVLALGVVCTGFAYIIYFKLVEQIGAASTLSVTFLIPIFGAIWGYLFLDEAITLNIVLGIVIVLAGTMLVTGFLPSKFLAKKAVNS